MTADKKAPLIEAATKKLIVTNIIPQNPDKYKVLEDMPDLLGSMVNLLLHKHINVPLNSILNVVLVKTAQMITSKRITLKEVENVLHPNYYAIVFMPSGFGKDKLLKELKEHFFLSFKLWFNDKARDFEIQKKEKIKTDAMSSCTSDKEQKAYIKEQTSRFRDMVIEISDGTLEGVFEDAKTFNEAGLGSIFTVLNEFGSYLKATSPTREQFLSFLYEAYDGVIPSKCIKSDKRQVSIENMPVNALLYSDHTLFYKNLKSMFENLMLTGLGRRSIVTFFSDKKLKDGQLSHNEEKTFFEQAKSFNDNLFATFLKLDDNACFILEKDAKDNVLNKYSSYLTTLFNDTDDEMLKKEVKSRELKALKLACLYACLNHPQEHIINSTDVAQAITTIQALSSDFKNFVTFKPKRKDEYERIFDFFVENLNKGFNKGELISKFMQLGFTRRKAKSEFDEAITFVSEIAQNKGYFLLQEPINNNSGNKYCLKPLGDCETDTKVIPLTKII